MNKEKQIEEMAKILCELIKDEVRKDCERCYFKHDGYKRTCKYRKCAIQMYEAGYRKAEEVRKETARECLKILHNIGGCDATEEWAKGFDAAIDEAYKEIADKYGVTAFKEDEE